MSAQSSLGNDALPLPLDIPSVVKRQATIVTQTVIASSSSSAAASSSGGGFPVAVAVPALVGGMALAILGALGYWWYYRRKQRERKVSCNSLNCVVPHTLGLHS